MTADVVRALARVARRAAHPVDGPADCPACRREHGQDQDADVVLAERSDGIVVRHGSVVAKAHAAATDPAGHRARLAVAAHPTLAGILLTPLPGPADEPPPDDGPPCAGPGSGLAGDGLAGDGPAREGPAREGPARDGGPCDGAQGDRPYDARTSDGPAQDGHPHDGPSHSSRRDRLPHGGGAHDGGAHDGGAHDGLSADGRRGDGLPCDGLSEEGLSDYGPPRDAGASDDLPHPPLPAHEGRPQDSSPQDSSPYDRSSQNRSPYDGPPQDGTPGHPQAGPPGPPPDGTPYISPPHIRPPRAPRPRTGLPSTGRPYHRLLHGRPVTAWPYGAPVDPERPEDAPWEETGALLARLHSVPVDALSRTPLPAMRGPAKAARALARLRAATAPGHPLTRAVEAAAAGLPAWARDEAPAPVDHRALCHGDLHLGQLVRHPAPDGPWQLIDIDDLGIGDPAWDLARPAAWYAAGLLPPAAWEAFLGAYRAAGGPAVPADGDPWPRLDVAARALTVQTTALAVSKAVAENRQPDDSERLMIEACARIAALPAQLAAGPPS